jgi:EmrB/QacA subfamily drug resistance transporter
VTYIREDELDEAAPERLVGPSTRDEQRGQRFGNAGLRLASMTRRAGGRGPVTPGSASPRRVFALVATAAFLATLDLFIVNIAFPALQAGFKGSTVAGVSWVLNGYAIVFAALLVPAGKIADIVGRRRVFVIGLLLFAAGSALCAAAVSLPMLIAARVLQAAGGAAVTPTSLGLLLPVLSPERRPAAIGAWAAIGAVGAAAGPPLGGLLTQLSWHWIFIVNVPLAVAAAALSVRALPEIRDAERPRLPDAVGSAFLIGAVGLTTLALVEGSSWSWDVRVWGVLVAAAVLAAGFVRRSARHPAPVLELSILRVRAFGLASVAAALFFAAFGAMLLGNVIFLTSVWHYSTLQAGIALTPGPITAAVLAPWSGKLSKRIGPGPVGAAGAVLFAAGSVWWIARVGLTPHYLTQFLPGMVIGGTGVGVILPSFTIAASATLPPARLATGMGAQTMFRQIGATIGVAAFVAILGTPHGSGVLDAFNNTRVFMIAAAAIAASALLAIPGRRTHPGGTGRRSGRTEERRLTPYSTTEELQP